MIASQRTVLVTGATGFLGRYVTAALDAAGWRVRRALHQVEHPPSDDSVVVGSIGMSTDWSAALAGVDAVVHLAARAHRPLRVQVAEQDLYVETNTNGTLTLARAAADSGVRHFVFASSIAVNGPTTDDRAPFNETDTVAPQSVYGRTKAAAEEGLAAVANASAMAVTAFRPPLIYGRAAKGSFGQLSRAIARGMPLPFGAVRNRRAFVAADNVASFVTFRLGTPATGFAPFIVADDEQVSTADFCRAIAHTFGRSPRLVPVPPMVLRGALRALGAWSLAESTLGSLEVDTGKARSIGWRPVVSQSEGLRRALNAGV